jgi:O-antigen/teichoic acid export membrane protein
MNKSRIALLISFAAAIVILFFIFLGIIVPLLGYSILNALVITSVNFVVFTTAYAYSIKKSNKTFLLFTIGGMGVRLLLMLALIFISIKFLKVDLLGFIFALFIWYTFFLIFEIAIVRRGLERR